MIRQGEIYWLDVGRPRGSEPGYRHPDLVGQNNLFNASLINTVVVCSLTSNLRRAASPGNVQLRKGEANLSKKSVVNVSQMVTVNKCQLTERIGQVSKQRFLEILEGIRLLPEPRDIS